MNVKNRQEHDPEFQEYLTTAPMTPPSALSQRISAQISHDLNPSAWSIFAKLAVIHLLVSLVTLSFCPQFGFRIIGDGMGLMHLFSVFGTYGCTMACGFFFLGTTALTATAVLRPEEIRVIRKTRFSELATLAFISLGFFIMVSPEMVTGLAIVWLLGSLAGGLSVLEAGWILRKRIHG